MIIKFLLASFVIVIVVFLLNSVGRNSIYVDNNELLFKTKSKDIYVLGLFVAKDEDESYQYIDISKYRFRTNISTTLFYEKILTDSDRIFDSSITSNVKFLFDAKEIDVLYKDSDELIMAQLKLPDNKYINLMAESSNDDALKIVYGFLNDEFLSFLKEIAKDDSKSLKYVASKLDAYQTVYNDEKFLKDEFSMSVTE